ncbi:winged helix-turn-helix transcriptional regulator [Aureibacter tunicatorum]|uniref:DNA-binding HxlR family transcriptional regulator n=1 Tax=Aureibacter tunicatorum TaxID=866807 RepID=A0AAE3XKH0_9BACT|nr:helix-turn-helix domain-containing protein [Aureibacter tunicatorum]MDR6238547.1 DNA-binding HxlR family transcriptional regulator [Aureibacter tunicatorum]
MKDFFRSKCPITSGLDIFGDKWTLVIIKQMLFEEKSTFKDFTDSQEAIATNILSSRLKQLETFEIINKNTHPDNKKTKIYTLTDKGLSFTPILIELMLWSKNNIHEIHPSMNIHPDLDEIKKHKKQSVKRIIESYNKFKESLFK